MSFGGVGSIHVVLKNNKKLSKHPRSKNGLGSFSPKVKTELNFTKASPQVLSGIRKRMTEEKKKNQTRIIVVFGFVMGVLITCLIFLNNNYDQMLSMI